MNEIYWIITALMVMLSVIIGSEGTKNLSMLYL